ncbi:MAG: hypothetical protein PGN16_03980 [Sphingomonas phyllosphaerae]|uniref:hypothetical protein n=1 Tax=Sphingomonas phyllosphaerae TaxID=257003 RepID=UPI002FF66682
MSERLDAAFAAARDHLAEKDQRIEFLEAAMGTVFVNLRRAPEKAMAVATFASAIMRGVSLQEAVAEAEKADDPSSIVEVTTPSQGLDAATVERCAQVAETQTERSNRDDESDEAMQYGAGYEQGCADAAAAIRALATEPHQHGGKA